MYQTETSLGIREDDLLKNKKEAPGQIKKRAEMFKGDVIARMSSLSLKFPAEYEFNFSKNRNGGTSLDDSAERNMIEIALEGIKRYKAPRRSHSLVER